MFAFLADIHISNKLKPGDYLKSLDVFLDHIKSCKEPCHAIFILGDLFDHRLDISESKLATIFLLKLVCNNCGKGNVRNVPCYFIHGTYSHDLEQYNIFLPMLQKIDNVEIFYTNEMGECTLHSGHKVLLLPQQYNEDYSDILKKKYDIIIGHGVISSELKNPCQASHGDYIFPVEILKDISKICVFGHYHEFTDFGDNIFYAGSMLRSKYNEDTPKQFLFCDDKYNVTTIKNPYALEYKTIHVNNPDELRTIISSEISTPHRFVIDSSDKEHLDEYSAIMNINKNNKNITYKMEDKSTDIPENNTLNITDLKVSNNRTISDPIKELIAYTNEKYNINVEKEIHEYTNKINRKEGTEDD